MMPIRAIAAASSAAAAAALVMLLAPPSRAGHAAASGAAGCPSLAGVKSFHGHASLTFHGTATREDPGTGGTETVNLSRAALKLTVDLTQKVSNGKLGIVIFIGHAHGGVIKVDDNRTDTYSDASLRYSGHESYNGPMLPSFGAAQLYIDAGTCAYKLHVSFRVWTDFSGSKQIQPQASVAGFFWTAREPPHTSLNLFGADGPDAYTGGCPANPLLAIQPCYDFDGGWAKEFETVAGTRGPFDQANIGWALTPSFKG